MKCKICGDIMGYARNCFICSCGNISTDGIVISIATPSGKDIYTKLGADE